MWEVGPGQWLASIEIFTSPDNVNWQEFLFDTIELRLGIVVADVLPSALSDQGSQLRNSESFKIFHKSLQAVRYQKLVLFTCLQSFNAKQRIFICIII